MARLRRIILITLGLSMAGTFTADAMIAEAPAESTDTPLQSPRLSATPWINQQAVSAFLIATDPYREFIGKQIPTNRFLEAVAQCETGQDPTHVGGADPQAFGEGITFRGAFGFWSNGNNGSVWTDYGGRELTGHYWADQATYQQQKIVYIRKVSTGYYNPIRKTFVQPKGLNNNNCVKYAGGAEYEIYRGR